MSHTQSSVSDSSDRASVMAAFDGAGRTRELVIADTERDDAWLSVDADDACSLEAWR